MMLAGLQAWGVSVGNLIEIAVLIGGIVFIFLTMRFDVGVLKAGMRETRTQLNTLENKFVKLELAIYDKIDSSERDIGETIAAHRERVTQIELYIRDNFVRKDSFYPVTNEIRQNINNVGAATEARLVRMETKIDQLSAPRGGSR